MRLRFPVKPLFVIVLLASAAFPQSPNGTLNGLVLDPAGRVIDGADVTVVNDSTDIQYFSKTNNEGIYVVTNLPPGPIGFKFRRRDSRPLSNQILCLTSKMHWLSTSRFPSAQCPRLLRSKVGRR